MSLKILSQQKLGYCICKPFTNSHFHFLIIVKLETSQVTRWLSKISSSIHSTLTPVLDVLGQPVSSLLTISVQQLFLTLCTILRHAALSLGHHLAPPTTGRKFQEGETYKNHITLRTSSRDQASRFSAIPHQLIPNSISLTESCTV
jgi:hypothetical protein